MRPYAGGISDGFVARLSPGAPGISDLEVSGTLGAARGGAPAHPQWYQNLVARPEVEVQVRADRFPARARTASPKAPRPSSNELRQ